MAIYEHFILSTLDTSYPLSLIFIKTTTSQAIQEAFSKSKYKDKLDLHAYTFYVNCEVLKKISLEFN